MQLAWKFGVIALVALVLVVLPGGGNALDVVLTALTIVFFAAIALLVARLYRQYRLDIDSLDPNIRLALYGSLAIAVLTFTGTGPAVQRGRRRGAGSGSRCWRWRPTACSGPGRATAATSSASVTPRALSRAPPRGTVGAWLASARESGQASVEAVAVVPALLLAALVGWQLVLAGHTLWLCAAAARAAARAEVVGREPARGRPAARCRARSSAACR